MRLNPKPMLQMTGFVVLIVLSASSMSLWANQCLTINCDCDSLAVAEEKVQCQKQETTLKKDCAIAGSFTGYCQVAGLKALPLPFSLYDIPAPLNSEEDIEQALTVIEGLVWSVSEDFKAAEQAQNTAAYGNALKYYKNIANGLDRIFGVHRQAYDSWRLLDEKGEAEDVADDGHKILKLWGDKLNVKAHGLWADRAESDPNLQNKRLTLAMNVLRYAGSAYQQSGELAAIAGERSDAASYWELAADTSETMVYWREQRQSKAQYVNYFRQQGVASWFRAAIYWEKLEEDEQAATAKSKAQKMLAVGLQTR